MEDILSSGMQTIIGLIILIFIIALVLITISTSFGSTLMAQEVSKSYIDTETTMSRNDCGEQRNFREDEWYYCRFTQYEGTAYSALRNESTDTAYGPSPYGGRADVWLEYCDGFCTKVAHKDNVHLAPGDEIYVSSSNYNPASGSSWHAVGNYDYLDGSSTTSVPSSINRWR